MDDDLRTHHIVTSRAEYREALCAAFEQAAEQGCREMILVDPDFAEWPLSEPRVIESLTRWARPHRKLTLLAQNFDAIVRSHPRWADWRRQWSHVVACRSPDDPDAAPLPSVLLAPEVVTVRRFDPASYRSSVSTDKADAVVLRDSLDALLQRSEEAFPASILGL